MSRDKKMGVCRKSFNLYCKIRLSADMRPVAEFLKPVFQLRPDLRERGRLLPFRTPNPLEHPVINQIFSICFIFALLFCRFLSATG